MNDTDYRIADIAHELPRLTEQLKRIADLLERVSCDDAIDIHHQEVHGK